MSGVGGDEFGPSHQVEVSYKKRGKILDLIMQLASVEGIRRKRPLGI